MQTETKKFENGVVPGVSDFTLQNTIEVEVEKDGEVVKEPITVSEQLEHIKGTDKKGNPVMYVLLSKDRIAAIREGKGRDVEKAVMEVGNDKSKQLSALLASVTTIDGKPVTMYDIADLSMKDYTSLQVVFAEINF